MGEKTVPGRGKKQCPKCERYLGVRSAKCDCGYEFPRKEKGTGEPLPTQTSLIGFIETIGKVKSWGEPYKTWDDARNAVKGVQEIIRAVGGERELLALIDYLEDNE
jgi:hypothetical protein